MKSVNIESSRAKFDLTILISVLTLVMLATANLWGVVESSEARYAEISREMLRSGDWVHPTLLKIHHYHKPPITYWITAASYSVFGVNAFAARFFLIVAYCLQIVIVYNLAKELFRNDQKAYYTSIVYATLPLVLISVRGLTTDAYLNLFVLLTIYFWIRFVNTKRVFFFYLTCSVLGLGFMTKGPVILILPFFAIAGIWNILPRAGLNVIRIGSGFVLFIAIAFYWFGYLIKENVLFADYFFFHHLIDRVAHAEVFSRREPWYYYLPIIPLVTLPWIANFIKEIFRPSSPDDGLLVRRILLWWFLIPLVVFSIASSKLVLYILPLSIGFSLVTGNGITNLTARSRLLYIITTSIVYIALAVSPFFAPQINIEPTFILIPIICLLTGIVLYLLDFNQPRLIPILSGMFTVNMLIYSSFLFHINSNQTNTLTAVANYIKENNLVNRQIVVYNELLPSLAFELDKDIVSLYGGNRSLERETQFEQTGAWRTTLIDTTGKPGNDTLQTMFAVKSVIVAKHELPPELKSLMHGNWNKETSGKWTIYYN